jgi:hypothetical protein
MWKGGTGALSRQGARLLHDPSGCVPARKACSGLPRRSTASCYAYALPPATNHGAPQNPPFLRPPTTPLSPSPPQLLCALLDRGFLLDELSPRSAGMQADPASPHATFMGLCRPPGAPVVRRIDFKLYHAAAAPFALSYFASSQVCGAGGGEGGCGGCF